MNLFERKYCIVDYSGNYYTVNEYDALVAADDEQTAEWFDILEANKRINNSGMAKSLRTVAANKSMCASKKKRSIEKTKNWSDDSNSEFAMEEIDLSLVARELLFLQSNIQKYQVELKKKISEADEEICDIMHFVELYERDDEQSLELMDKIFDCRKKRRKVKDELFRAETFAKIFTAGGIANLLKDVNRQIENMSMREYMPRRLHSLFVQGVKLEEREEEKFINEDIEYDKEEQSMVYERHDTIFDGKENDWQSIIGQQADLFENIEQYAINLELDMEELNNQIEELMITCEDANCNVTQGYKMFKQIKELRLARKKKAAELDRVSAIIECFDCSAMADTYRYLVDQLGGEAGKEITVLTVETDADAEEVREAI